jgi:Skp family chaperone for outer membrane proteins
MSDSKTVTNVAAWVVVVGGITASVALVTDHQGKSMDAGMKILEMNMAALRTDMDKNLDTIRKDMDKNLDTIGKDMDKNLDTIRKDMDGLNDKIDRIISRFDDRIRQLEIDNAVAAALREKPQAVSTIRNANREETRIDAPITKEPREG